MTIKEAINIAKSELPGIDTAAKECTWLFAKNLSMSVASVIANDDAKIDDAVFESFLEQRKRDIPFEYIVNEACFYGYDFFVDNRCLIPRPETELLVELAKRVAQDIDAKSLLDICTGSGAVACTMKKLMPNLSVTASDISQDALEVAKINAQRLEIDINFLLSDLFSNIKNDSFDILTANPPYIQNGYKLEKNVLHEPHLALFGGESGEEIIKAAIDGFYEMGFKAFVCEMGFDQKAPIEAILKSKPASKFGFYKDYAGLDRGFWIIKENR